MIGDDVSPLRDDEAQFATDIIADVDSHLDKNDVHDNSNNAQQVVSLEQVTSSSSSDQEGDDQDDEPVDPRVQVELETLNTLTDLINKLELELDDSRAAFRSLLSDTSTKIQKIAKKLGSCVEKSKPYYEARVQAKVLQNKTQADAARYERATSSHLAAKEMVMLSEEGLAVEGRMFDSAFQEMLNHATMKVNDAERERVISQREHLKSSKEYIEAERQVAALHKKLKRSIAKARPYFEAKAEFNQMMENQIQVVRQMESSVAKAKRDYASALKRLEGISYEIHERRNSRMISALPVGHVIGSRERKQKILMSERVEAEGAEEVSNVAACLSDVQLSMSIMSPVTPSRSAPPDWLAHRKSTSTVDSDIDGDSVASVDTLDDRTIEKLMLEPALDKYRDIVEENE